MRLWKTKVISEEELRMYLGYRNCIQPFSVKEYEKVMIQMEERHHQQKEKPLTTYHVVNGDFYALF
ncbi:MAG: hypothetical protein ACI4FZ_04700 [Lachnospiraceae bacterium]